MNKIAYSDYCDRDKFLRLSLSFGILFSMLLSYSFCFVHPLRIDELASLNLILTNSLAQSLDWIRQKDTQQPLFYIVLMILTKVSKAIPFLKTALFSLSLGSLFFHYKISRHFLSKNYALFCTFLFSLSFLFVLHSGEIRPYGIYLFTALGAINNLLRFTNNNELKYLFFAILFFVFSFLNHYVALSLAFSSFLYLILIKKIKLNVVSTSVFLGVVLVAMSPFYADILRIFNHYHFYRDPISLKLVISYFIYLGNGVFFITQFFVMLGFYVYKKRRIGDVLYFLLTFGFLPFFLLVLKSLVSSPALEPRYVIFSLSALVLVSTIFLKELKSNCLRFIFGLIFVTSLLYQIFGHESYQIAPYRVSSHLAAQKVKELSQSHNMKIVYCGICLYPYLRKAKESNQFLCKSNWSLGSPLILLVQAKQGRCPKLEKRLGHYSVESIKKYKGVDLQLLKLK